MKPVRILLAFLLCILSSQSLAQDAKRGYWICFAVNGVSYGYLNNEDSSVVELDSIPTTTSGIYGSAIETVQRIPPKNVKHYDSPSFFPNSYNKILNPLNTVWQEGAFKDGKLWMGKLLIYKSDGTLVKKQWFMEGKFHSEITF